MRYLFVVCLSLAAGLLSSIAVGADRPNVVLILSDDQAWTDYGFMGHKVIQTPHLDQLAEESLVYTRGYVPTSLCRPSLMTLVTGRYPHEHGITGNDPPKGTPREAMLKFVRDTPTLPRLLSTVGYRTFQAGKWWEGSYQDGGFTHGMTHGDPKRGGRHGDVGLKIGREGLQPIFDFIDDSGNQPFFIWYAPMLPHQPHNPPERLLAKYRDKTDSLHVAKYYAMCEWWDESCGQLLDYLEKKQLRENTLVIYTCDNGWVQNPNKPTFDLRSKRAPYDDGVRTPILCRWPSQVKPQQIDDRPASTVNFAYTVLKACGVETNAIEGMQKADLLEPQKLPQVLYGEIFEHDVADVDAPAKSLIYRWCLKDNQKLIVSSQGKAELFDVGSDPHEAKNIAEERPAVVKALTATLDAWWKP